MPSSSTCSSLASKFPRSYRCGCADPRCRCTRHPFPPQAVFGQLAAKFAAAKFVSIVFNNCIPNYPESALPCVLVYTNGDLARQIVGVQE